ncbi:MAG: ABC transporter ATP-binding protein [Coriobacteriales bacterium]|nr:ABC transporter ATP-binding protein [Coriobacteriales bacterium]
MGADKPHDLKRALKRTLDYLGNYKWTILLVAIITIVSTAFNVVGPKILGNATTTIAEGLMARLAGTGGIDFLRLGQILVTVLVLYGVSSLFGLAQGWLMTGLVQRLTYRMRKDIAAKVNRTPFRDLDNQSTGDILSRITNDVDTVGQSLNQCVTVLVSAVVTILGVIVVMLSISWIMTLIVLLVVPLSAWLLVTIIKHSQKYFYARQADLGAVNGQVEEVFGGHAVVQAFNREEAASAEFYETSNHLYESFWKARFLSGLVMPGMTLVSNLGYVLVAVSGAALAIRGTIQIGDIQAFIQYVKNLTNPITQLGEVLNTLQSLAASAERVFEFLDAPEESADPDDVVKFPDEIESIDFEHVSFGYEPGKPVINDLNLHVDRGQTVALVGPTGAGKTTVVKLIMRFYDVDEGAIKINGVDIRRYRREDLRAHMGMVLQETWLFQDSIMENIRYGRIEATDEEVRAAADAAFADHFIRALPEGYAMEINEEADNISAGQRQLLTIARAILANNEIMILDEATSSVDTRTEARIQQAMDALTAGRTSFVIAHRLSTIRNADLILVIDKGDIEEQGTHDELLARGGFYADLYNAQFEDAAR